MKSVCSKPSPHTVHHSPSPHTGYRICNSDFHKNRSNSLQSNNGSKVVLGRRWGADEDILHFTLNREAAGHLWQKLQRASFIEFDAVKHANRWMGARGDAIVVRVSIAENFCQHIVWRASMFCTRLCGWQTVNTSLLCDDAMNNQNMRELQHTYSTSHKRYPIYIRRNIMCCSINDSISSLIFNVNRLSNSWKWKKLRSERKEKKKKIDEVKSYHTTAEWIRHTYYTTNA